tara:strand:+ start:1910 stop:2986 length:1077 start_codon:yes stop_codon:yes gene_type:complete
MTLEEIKRKINELYEDISASSGELAGDLQHRLREMQEAASQYGSDATAYLDQKTSELSAAVKPKVEAVLEETRGAMGYAVDTFQGHDGETNVSDVVRTGGALAAFFAGSQAIRLFADENTGWFSFNGLLAVVAGTAAAVGWFMQGGGHDFVAGKLDEWFGGKEKMEPAAFVDLPLAEQVAAFKKQDNTHQKTLLNDHLSGEQAGKLIAAINEAPVQIMTLSMITDPAKRAEAYGKLDLPLQKSLLTGLADDQPDNAKALFNLLPTELQGTLLTGLEANDALQKQLFEGLPTIQKPVVLDNVPAHVKGKLETYSQASLGPISDPKIYANLNLGEGGQHVEGATAPGAAGRTQGGIALAT